jgi:DNA polymerase-3 subunit epsilon/ATP-dependent DNA helicase DinG
VDEFSEDDRGRNTPPGSERTVPISAARRAQPLWDDVEEAAAQLDVTLMVLSDRVTQARTLLTEIGAGGVPALERAQGMLGALAEAVIGARMATRDALLRADASRIVWLTDGEGGVKAHAAPLEVADRLATDLYAGRESVTATSATLSAQGTFDFSVQTLGLFEPDTLAVPSPFDYRRAVLAIVVDDIPTPEQPGYAEAVHRVLAAAAAGASGRTLALFTSHSAVRAAAGALAVPLATQGIGVLAQQLDGSPARLLRTLMEQPRTLLLGTAAFWEGVDVRGDALSQIAIARLPFPVPSDPIYAGRAALYDDPFNEYALPQAVLRFRQGFGRLIRGSEERGVFLLLDRRVLTRPYGEAFLDALPDCEVRRVPASAVGDAVARWLA